MNLKFLIKEGLDSKILDFIGLPKLLRNQTLICFNIKNWKIDRKNNLKKKD